MLRRSLLVLFAASVASLARADVILDWNRFALPIATGVPGTTPPVTFRAMANEFLASHALVFISGFLTLVAGVGFTGRSGCGFMATGCPLR